MIPELGQFALALALCLALAQGTLPLVGAATGNRGMIQAGSISMARAEALKPACSDGAGKSDSRETVTKAGPFSYAQSLTSLPS